jgi:hypothetical protein
MSMPLRWSRRPIERERSGCLGGLGQKGIGTQRLSFLFFCVFHRPLFLGADDQKWCPWALTFRRTWLDVS